MKRPRSEKDVADRLRKLSGGRVGDEAIEVIASRLVVKGRSGKTQLESIFPALGVIAAQPVASIDSAGELRREPNGYRIVYSADMPEARARFTIAHELAHAVLNGADSEPPADGFALEAACDRIAAALLMPREDFLQVVTGRPTVASIRDAARLFDVSLQAAAIRAEQVTLSPTTMAFCMTGEQVVWETRGVSARDPLLQQHVREWRNGARRLRAFFLVTKRGPGYWALEGDTTEDGTMFVLRRASQPLPEPPPGARTSI